MLTYTSSSTYRHVWEILVCAVSAQRPKSFPPSPTPVTPHLRSSQPLFQPCGSPSPSLLHALRSHHILPPQGLPILPTAPSPPSPTPQSPSSPPSSPPLPLPPPILPNSSSPLTAASWRIVIAGPSPAMAASDYGRFQALSAASVAARKLLGKVFGEGRVGVYVPAPLVEGE